MPRTVGECSAVRCRGRDSALRWQEPASMTAYAHYPSLTDRTVLVTGGASGIGASLVEHFAAQGARVGFIDIDGAAGAALAGRLAGARTAPLFVAADLTETRALRGAVDAVRQRFGPIAALMNNAAHDAGDLGRGNGRQPETSVLCRAGCCGGHEALRRWLDRQLRIDQLDAQAGR